MDDSAEHASVPTVRPDTRPEVVDSEDGPATPFPICLSGEIVKGFGRGSKELGIPTANLAEEAIPKLLEHAESGIYYGLASIDGNDNVYDMVMSVGWNPYYKNTVRSAEVHVIHKFHDDFYNKNLKVIVVGFIRPEYNYTDLDSLVADINEDIRVAQRSLARPAYRKYREDDFFHKSIKH
ncbi:Riboflavin kinase [Taphrina deformans PYCC 5710]|uniref:Riboflavin kinase n=1 Tax=Taphrina deformans (strain PYCC 5710 / ATCC 11124 / CBS 356.35 / IMI 108563 / JCM 9778 / NBRC 8474) TaxID=1097556 RepID=R4XBC7_TAPDE|nr:Riboflavin kinase [Taphrina deformans PYCC 5710]|eukprot:CCG83154.1 Riboflavin kinase [Taphrina deformans PYCC 5710]